MQRPLSVGVPGAGGGDLGYGGVLGEEEMLAHAEATQGQRKGRRTGRRGTGRRGIGDFPLCAAVRQLAGQCGSSGGLDGGDCNRRRRRLGRASETLLPLTQ